MPVSCEAGGHADGRGAGILPWAGAPGRNGILALVDDGHDIYKPLRVIHSIKNPVRFLKHLEVLLEFFDPRAAAAMRQPCEAVKSVEEPLDYRLGVVRIDLLLILLNRLEVFQG